MEETTSKSVQFPFKARKLSSSDHDKKRENVPFFNQEQWISEPLPSRNEFNIGEALIPPLPSRVAEEQVTEEIAPFFYQEVLLSHYPLPPWNTFSIGEALIRPSAPNET